MDKVHERTVGKTAAKFIDMLRLGHTDGQVVNNRLNTMIGEAMLARVLTKMDLIKQEEENEIIISETSSEDGSSKPVSEKSTEVNINEPLSRRFNKNKEFGPRMTVSVDDQNKILLELHAAATKTSNQNSSGMTPE